MITVWFEHLSTFGCQILSFKYDTHCPKRSLENIYKFDVETNESDFIYLKYLYIYLIAHKTMRYTGVYRPPLGALTLNYDGCTLLQMHLVTFCSIDF